MFEVPQLPIPVVAEVRGVRQKLLFRRRERVLREIVLAGGEGAQLGPGQNISLLQGQVILISCMGFQTYSYEYNIQYGQLLVEEAEK